MPHPSPDRRPPGDSLPGATHAGGAPAPRASGPRTGTRLATLTWSHLLIDGASNYLPGVLPAVIATIGAPIQMAGVLVTSLMIGQMLQPIAGRLADRMGGRSLVTWGLLISSIAGGLLGVAQSTWLLIVLVVLIGVGNSLFHPQALAGVRSMLSGRHGLITSVFLVGGEIGRGLWPTAASLIVAHLGLANLWIVAIPGILTAPFLARIAPVLPRRPRGGAAIRMREHAAPLALLMGYQGIRALTTYAFVTFIPLLWDQRDHGLVAGASIITTMTIVGVVGNLGGGHLTDRIGTRPVLIISAVAAAVLLPPTAYLDGPAEWIVSAVLGIALFLTGSTTVLLGQDIFPENHSMGSGLALGFTNGLGALLLLALGFAVGENIVAAFWVLAALSLASVVPALRFDRRLMHVGGRP